MASSRLETLSDRLDNDLSRRRRELSDIRLLARGSRGNKAGALRRAGHVMAYAHWEGFVKFALGEYVTDLSRRNCLLSDVKDGLQAAVLTKLINVNAIENPFFAASEILKKVQSSSSAALLLDADQVTRTGNLTSKKFKTFLDMCALEYLAFYATRENFIDEVLCGRRHRIAHGGTEPISADDLDEAVDGALHLCDEINDQIIEALLYDSYLRKP